MDANTKKLYALIKDIRLSFNLLKALANEMHKDLGVNASMRAVMENLSGGERKTVPDIARSRGVSRQHIQVIVNRLNRIKLTEVTDNPVDKRTLLVSLTKQGEHVFNQIQEREAVELQRLSEGFSADELNLTLNTLGKITKALKGNEND